MVEARSSRVRVFVFLSSSTSVNNIISSQSDQDVIKQRHKDIGA